MSAPYKESMMRVRAQWGEVTTWATIKRLAPTITPVNYLAAIDRRYNTDGIVIPQVEERQIYVKLFKQRFVNYV